MDLVIIVPMLGRAHRVDPLLESIRATCTARVLFAVTPGDEAVIDAIDAAGEQRITVPRRPVGDYARKINAGYRASTEQLIFCGADDLLFHPGWFEAATAELKPGVGVVGTNDLGSPRVLRGEHSTHSLVTRDYADHHGTIDAPGAVMHEGYIHEYVDDELVGTARKRGAWAFASDARVQHLHPNWNPDIVIDELYALQPRRMRLGRSYYQRRKRLWM